MRSPCSFRGITTEMAMSDALVAVSAAPHEAATKKARRTSDIRRSRLDEHLSLGAEYDIRTTMANARAEWCRANDFRMQIGALIRHPLQHDGSARSVSYHSMIGVRTHSPSRLAIRSFHLNCVLSSRTQMEPSFGNGPSGRAAIRPSSATTCDRKSEGNADTWYQVPSTFSVTVLSGAGATPMTNSVARCSCACIKSNRMKVRIGSPRLRFGR